MILGQPVYHYQRNPKSLALTTGTRTLLHPIRFIQLELTLYEYDKRPYRETGLYAKYRRVLPRYLFTVTITD